MAYTEQDLQKLLTDKFAELELAGGAQVAIFDGGGLIEAAVGVANHKAALAMTTDTLIQTGSATKVYNATLLMTLVDEGRIDLDIPICEYLPDLKLGREGHEKIVTLRHLMSMSSGMDKGPYTGIFRGDEAVENYVALLSDIPMIYEPGEGYGYSNASTIVAGHIAESLLGENWDQLLTERILRPANLNYSASLMEELISHRIAQGYHGDSHQSQVVPTWSYGRGMAPAGSTLCSSAGDLVRFAQIFLNKGASINGQRILSESASDAMQSVHVSMPNRFSGMADNWCLGPHHIKWNDWDVYGHSGTNLSGGCTLLWVPDKKLAAAVTVNGMTTGARPLAHALFDEIFSKVFDIKKPPAEKPGSGIGPDPNHYTGIYEAHHMRITVKLDRGDLRYEKISSLLPCGKNTKTTGNLVHFSKPHTFALIPDGISKIGYEPTLGFVFKNEEDDKPIYLVDNIFPLRHSIR